MVRDDQVYAVRGAAEAKKSGTEMIMFDTPMIDCGSKMTAFVFETVNFASSIIDYALETSNSTPEMIDCSFNMINCELETIISGLHIIIVKASITARGSVAIFWRMQIITDKSEIIIDAIVAVFSEAT